MPLYTFDCQDCGNIEECLKEAASSHEHECTKCGSVNCTRRFPAPKVVTFRAGWYEHAGPEPVFCETAQDLQDACNKHGGISSYLENSTFKVKRNYDEYEETRKQDTTAARDAENSVLPE